MKQIVSALTAFCLAISAFAPAAAAASGADLSRFWCGDTAYLTQSERADLERIAELTGQAPDERESAQKDCQACHFGCSSAALASADDGIKILLLQNGLTFVRLAANPPSPDPRSERRPRAPPPV